MAARYGYVIVVTTLALGLGACGSGDERSKLQKQISSGLATKGTPADVAGCISKQAGQLPISDERRLAAGLAPGKSPDTSAGQPYARTAAQCLAQGKGIDGFRKELVGQVVQNVPASAPAYRSCLQSKFGAVTPQQLSAAVKEGGLTQSAGVRLGSSVATQCVDQPAVLSELRAVFLASAARGVKNSKLSPAFQACFTRKAQNVPSDLLKKAALAGPGSQSTALGQNFGRQIGRQCIAEGVKP